ncbi:hypothetical protein LQ757_12950 [Agromyces sp. SYSU K20354]|uniref:hypothetical protein n=1 Tax=Agromyces cavernae TaxID=2898659 RepID=UPI001E3CBA6F|nr:hypothetical protein [Agromyces cavernae]MCD2443184.1 hypothetical protein [Agromyces cavernae]
MIRRSAITVSTSNADDAAYRAVHDVAIATEDIDDARIVGGQMVGLLLAAFPTAAAIIRRTADADAALSTQVAASGALHSAFTRFGYEPKRGNRYESEDGRAIDVLVPSDTRFRQVELGGRGFDAVPGLRVVLAGHPILIDLDVTLTDGTRLQFAIKVPTVEHALILKALSYSSRHAPKDLVDIHNLLQVAHLRGADEIGGWRIDKPELPGSRGDAQRELYQLAATAHRNPMLNASGVRPEVIVALIRAKVGQPRT